MSARRIVNLIPPAPVYGTRHKLFHYGKMAFNEGKYAAWYAPAGVLATLYVRTLGRHRVNV